MQPNSSGHIFSRQNSAAYSQRWQIGARGGLLVQVEWNIEGAAVEGHVFAGTDVSAQAFSLSLPNNRHVMLLLNTPTGKSDKLFVDVTLSLSSDQKTAELICNVPLNSDQYFNGVIGAWPLDPGQDDPAQWPDMPTDQ